MLESGSWGHSVLQTPALVFFFFFFFFQVFLVRKITGPDAGTLFAMKVLKKATLKGKNRNLIKFLKSEFQGRRIWILRPGMHKSVSRLLKFPKPNLPDMFFSRGPTTNYDLVI